MIRQFKIIQQNIMKQSNSTTRLLKPVIKSSVLKRPSSRVSQKEAANSQRKQHNIVIDLESNRVSLSPEPQFTKIGKSKYNEG
ncbi:hypothetical protein FGO68_gene3271 [Halteria grandinella]|uniref:Uncharacterized protein n=1 Tax=Halteria grandinella TaxID=5974 RepID=A0A8J8P009_HALGN|nr:hypothetical protein FGO68_gene3271 [Halteria grandinella]